MRWGKVLANSGLAFFSTLASMFTMSSFLNLEISVLEFLFIAIFNSSIYGGIALFKTIKEEEEYNWRHKTTKMTKKITHFLDVSLPFP